VLPGTGKSFEQFHADDGMCQQFAMTEAQGPAAGAAGAVASAPAMQRKYDLSYIQCMYAKGHRVPVLGPMAGRPVQAPGQVPPPSGQLPASPPAAPR
jgi:hypothetical protein